MSVLLCYDGSPSARNAIATAVNTLRDAEVTLLHVWPRPVPFLSDSFSDAGIQVDTTIANLNAQAVARAEQIVADGRRLAAELCLDVDTRLAPSTGRDWETILATADELDSDMIVVGAHPRGTPGPSLDSTSEQVVEHSHRPVLVVPAA